MEESEDSQPQSQRNRKYLAYYLPVITKKGETEFELIPVPTTNGRFDLKVRCQDDSLPENFEPQAGHWVKVGEYYDVIGSQDAINTEDAQSLMLMKNGVRLNPYGDEKITYGISSKRFKPKGEFDHMVISRN